MCVCLKNNSDAAVMEEGKDEDGRRMLVCVCQRVCVCAEQTALAGFLLESPGQKTHESAASRIYSQLIKLAFVLLLGQQPVSINIHTHTHTHIPTWANKHAPVHRRAVTEAEGRETRKCGKRRWEKKAADN